MRRKHFMLAILLLLGAGFALVSTTLLMTGNVKIATNDIDFDVRFTKAVLDRTDISETAISQDGKIITFETSDLSTVGDISKLDFEVTNNSEMYDAVVSIDCTAEGAKNSYYEITKDVKTPVLGKTTEAGKVEVSLLKASTADFSETFTCTLTATAKERTSKAETIPEVEPKSFSEDDWRTIARAVRLGKTDVYNVGDTKTIDMGSYGTHEVRIANLSNKECVGVASETTCGFVVEFADIIDKQRYNPAGTLYGKNYPNGYSVGGWPASSIYNKVNTDIYNALPQELQEVIIDTKVVSSHSKTDGQGNNVTENFVSYDKLFLLSVNEIYGTSFSSTATSVKGIDKQLDWYRDIGKVTRTEPAGAIKKYEGVVTDWYLRTLNASQDHLCYFVLGQAADSGLWYNEGCFMTRGVSPAFRIG